MGKNTLAYFVIELIRLPKKVNTLSPWAFTMKCITNVIKSMSMWARIIVPVSHFSPSLMFESKAGAYPSGASYRTPL